MTTNPTPGFKLDPSALSEAVPLKRAGTQEVRLYQFSPEGLVITVNTRTWLELSSSWPVEQAPM